MATEYIQGLISNANFSSEIIDTIKDSMEGFMGSFTDQINANPKLLSDIRQRFKAKQPKPPVEEPPHKPPVIDKATRDLQLLEHQLKIDVNKEFTKKLKEERLERERRIKEREEKQTKKLLDEIEEKNKEREDYYLQQELEKQKRIEELKQRAEERKKDIETRKEIGQKEYQKVVSNKPLFKQMEDKFNQQVLMPELEKKKAELAKKRMLFQPINPQEIYEHSKKINEIRKEQEQRRQKELVQRSLEEQVNFLSPNLQSHFTEAIMEEERRKREEAEKVKEDVINRKLKMMQYADLVKEMFQPSVDKSKQTELEERIEKIKTKPRKMVNKTSVKSWSGRESGNENEETGSEGAISKPKKWKRKPLDLPPGKPPKKEFIKIDYLAEMRKEKDGKDPLPSRAVNLNWEHELEDENLTPEEKANRIRHKAELMEKKARIQEFNIGKMNIQNHQGIEATEQVNDMIIGSIKAKLALLQQVTGK
ncbi:unnamed protein product [Blepharisma stoltei]|uniref:Uncharacterized protein n=1 Tax=Blepharisma stoltei TaxID=1481888 RepID=A0AAU9KDE9_9CILI|nr:unnamed protein product [Blepharisma stoltei]